VTWVPAIGASLSFDPSSSADAIDNGA
jgi:hypothetical protein